MKSSVAVNYLSVEKIALGEAHAIPNLSIHPHPGVPLHLPSGYRLCHPSTSVPRAAVFTWLLLCRFTQLSISAIFKIAFHPKLLFYYTLLSAAPCFLQALFPKNSFENPKRGTHKV